jgi:hypothetical protein
MSVDAGHYQQPDIRQGHTQRDLEHSLGSAPAMNVDVHPLSVRAAEAGFKRHERSGAREKKTNHRCNRFCK